MTSEKKTSEKKETKRLSTLRELKRSTLLAKKKNIYNIHKTTGKTKKRPTVIKEKKPKNSTSPDLNELEQLTPKIVKREITKMKRAEKTQKRPVILND